jgi:hypothetical protein
MHALEVRVKQLEKQARYDFRYSISLLARLAPFLRKEAAGKEAVKKEDDDNEEDQQAWPSGSNDDDGPASPIRFPRVMRWFKCPICLNYLYEHKNGLLFHIKSFIRDAMSPPDVVEQHIHLSRLLDMQP